MRTRMSLAMERYKCQSMAYTTLIMLIHTSDTPHPYNQYSNSSKGPGNMASSQGTILLTGANGGLGSAIVAGILKKPELAAYTGVYTVRKAATATQLKTVLNSGSKAHKHDIVDLDLSSLASVRKMATEINRRVAAGELPPIKALILNAAYQDHEELVGFLFHRRGIMY